VVVARGDEVEFGWASRSRRDAARRAAPSQVRCVGQRPRGWSRGGLEGGSEHERCVEEAEQSGMGELGR
jgi:hypothetical protein